MSSKCIECPSGLNGDIARSDQLSQPGAQRIDQFFLSTGSFQLQELVHTGAGSPRSILS